MNELDQKINTHFPGLVVRKDLVKTVKGNAIVPSYVLEYLLGQYCATSDEATIQTGIETVKEILRKHYVHRNEAGLVRSNIKEKGRYKVIDKISVALNDKADVYEAEFSNLGIKKVLVDSGTVKAHPKLLVSGVWCIADIEYEFTEDKNTSPWILSTLKPIQLSHFDFDGYIAARRQLTTEEWIDLLIQSIGFNPEMFGRRSKLIQLIRLIPYCERNYNLIELGPKGTGKSHIYSEFSPHGILISGGEVTVPKLFVNNASGKIGLVGYWDCVAFDEFAGKQKRVDKALVDIMKNYMANKSFSRGVETLGAEASMVFVGNTQHTVPYMLKHSDLFCELPEKFYDSAFLDRIHFYIPGWEVDIIRGEMFSDGYGFVVDYLAEILRSLRNHDYSDRYRELFSLSSDISTRDRDGINKTFSGLMKILFPHDGATKEEIEELLRFSIEGRKRVKDQVMRIDPTYANVRFVYLDSRQQQKLITTLEEEEYPHYYSKTVDLGADGQNKEPEPADEPKAEAETILKEKHITFQENQKGVSFDTLLGPYLKGATRITVTDPYIRLFYQVRNFMEFMETIVKHKAQDAEVAVHLVTVEDDFKGEQQKESFEKIRESCSTAGINFTWEFDGTASIHARHIVTDHGWKISMDRGLDIFQHHEMNDAFNFSNRLQQYRQCKAFEVTFIRIETSASI
jgi:ATP-dependent Lon protease